MLLFSNAMVIGSNLCWQGAWTKAVYTGGPGMYMYGRGYTGDNGTLSVQFLKFVIEIDQSEITRSHIFTYH